MFLDKINMKIESIGVHNFIKLYKSEIIETVSGADGTRSVYQFRGMLSIAFENYLSSSKTDSAILRFFEDTYHDY